MIVSNLPPSFLLGSLATAIRTPAFHCFVGTTRNGTVSESLGYVHLGW